MTPHLYTAKPPRKPSRLRSGLAAFSRIDWILLAILATSFAIALAWGV